MTLLFVLCAIAGLLIFRSLDLMQTIKSNTVVLVVMGCAIPEVQADRVKTAIKYVKGLPKRTKVIWFLTGGVKDAIFSKSHLTEAETMQSQLVESATTDIVLDTKATNTAENLAHLKQWLISTFGKRFPKIVISTSEFHKKRASTILKGIFEKGVRHLDVEWTLGKEACAHCWSDEPFHMKNVEMDVYRAHLMMGQ
jgi:hypothetical protein